MFPLARPGRSSAGFEPERRHRAAYAKHRSRIAPALEPLEGRELLSVYTGPSAVRNIQTNGGVFQIQVEGPGLIKVHSAAKGAIDLSAFGTTAATALDVTLVRPRIMPRAGCF